MVYENGESKTYLPGGSITPEVAERGLEPVVDLVQCQLLVWRFYYSLQDRK